ncbi:MAG: PAS domain S-box protein [Nitrospirota bacterium]|jgi:PAS domain S-box-containing protein
MKRINKHKFNESIQPLIDNALSLPDSVIVTDLDQNVIAMNEGAIAKFKLQKEQILGKSIALLFPQESQENVLESLEECIENGTAKDEEIAIWSGHEQATISVAYATIKDKTMKPVAAYLLVREAKSNANTRIQHVRDRAAASIRESEQLFRSIFNYSPIGTAIIDLNAQIVDSNPNLQEMLGYSGEELLSLHFEQITHPEDVTADESQFNKLIKGKINSYRKVKRYVKKNGAIIWGELSMSLITDSKGAPQFCIGMINDITKRVKSDVRLKESIRFLESLRTIDLSILSNYSQDVLVDEVIAAVLTNLKADAASIFGINSTTRQLYLIGHKGYHTQKIHNLTIRLGKCFPGHVIRQKENLVINDIPSYLTMTPKMTLTKEYIQFLEEEKVKSYFGTPLIVRGDIKGVLEVFHRSSIRITSTAEKILMTLAGQVGIGMENGELHQHLSTTIDDLTIAYDDTIEGWARALDFRDKESEGHSRRVTDMTVRIADMMEIDDKAFINIQRGALLHDIGKLGVPDAILLKPGKLNDKEWGVMQRHPEFAFELLSPIEYLKDAVHIPYCHHEKWNGTGYPRGLKEEAIPIEARIFAVVDIWDALNSDRPYRPKWEKVRILEYLKTLSGTELDSKVVEMFIKNSEVIAPETHQY